MVVSLVSLRRMVVLFSPPRVRWCRGLGADTCRETAFTAGEWGSEWELEEETRQEETDSGRGTCLMCRGTVSQRGLSEAARSPLIAALISCTIFQNIFVGVFIRLRPITCVSSLPYWCEA